MKISLIVLISYLLFAPYSFASKGYFEGYIVTHSGDTIYGMVKDRTVEPFQSMLEKIKFIEKGTRRPKKYRADEISGYKCANREYRVVRYLETSEFFKIRYYIGSRGDFVFLRLIKDAGPIIYYEREFTHDDNDYIDSFPLFHLTHTNEMVRVTQGILGLKKKRLSEYFADCQGLVSAINSDQLKTSEDVFNWYINSCLD
jgi:hypothetical protein